MRAALVVVLSLLMGCATATAETHPRWYWGVAAVAAVAGICLLLGKASDAITRHAQRNEHDETDEAGA